MKNKPIGYALEDIPAGEAGWVQLGAKPRTWRDALIPFDPPPYATSASPALKFWFRLLARWIAPLLLFALIAQFATGSHALPLAVRIFLIWLLVNGIAATLYTGWILLPWAEEHSE